MLTRRRAWAVACAALAMGLTTIGAQAQPRNDPRNDPRRNPGQRPPAQRPPAQMQHRPPGPPQAHGPMRGAGPDRRWHQGDRVPPMYRTRHYVVNDWHAHHLGRPPRGYHWVQYGADYLLVAIATGVIVQIILSQ